MEYATQDYVGSALNANVARPEGELEGIASRISRMAESADRLAGKLREHADNVHGPSPEQQPTGGTVAPVRSGLIGTIHDALDRLERAHSLLAEQVGRNCALA